MFSKLKLYFLALLSIFTFSDLYIASDTEKKENLIILKNEKSQLGIMKNAGGRIVFYKIPGGKNVLKSNEDLWEFKLDQPLSSALNMSIIPFNGHITWVGPQSEWWTQQDEITDLRDRRSKWPPDPYLIYAECEIIDRSDSHLVLKNPDSPFTQLSLIKTITLLENGDVEIHSEIENISDSAAAWDIWFNTRLNGDDRFFVPVKNADDIRMEYHPENFNVIEENIIDGFFTFSRKDNHYIRKIYSSKAYIYPADNKIFAFSGSNFFSISFEMFSREDIHPEQGLVEVYNRFKPDNDNLLELEHHTKYVQLQPGEKLRGTTHWSIREYKGENTIDEQIKYLKMINGL